MKNAVSSLSFIFLLLFTSWASQASQPSWLRYPAISPDGTSIAFTYKGDLYRVPASGGRAIQLTFHEAHDFMPVWSHDGKQLAFASDRYGNFDVFVMASEGGEALRLTYHSNDEYPYTFSRDNASVLFKGLRQDLAEHRQYPTSAQAEVYQVPAKGGQVNMFWTHPAEDLQLSKDGKKIVYHDNKGFENPWRKHHKSSIARDLWLYYQEKDEHRPLSSFYGENRNPVFNPDESSIYYLGEESGVFNVQKLSLAEPENSLQLTHFEQHPVRFLSISDEGLMCFSQDGKLYTFREGEEPQAVNLSIQTQEVSNPLSWEAISGGISEMAISPNGKEIAFIARGEVFVTSTEASFTKQITQSPAQERFVSFSEDGKKLIYAREEKGKWAVFESEKVQKDETYFFNATLVREHPLLQNEHENYLPALSPDGKKLAFVENRKSIKVKSLENGEVTTLMDESQLFHMRDGDQYFRWSPDSRWLLASYRPTLHNGEVVILDTEGKQAMKNLTKSGYQDMQPTWNQKGDAMLWFSNREGLKSFATSGGSQLDVYALFFTQKAWDHFKMTKEEFELDKALKEQEKKKKKEDEGEDKKKKKKKEKEKPETISIEWEDLEDRKARLTIHSSSLADAVLSKDGEKLYYLTKFEKSYNLWSTELRSRETKMEISLGTERGGSLHWDQEMEKLYLLADGKIQKLNLEKGSAEAIKMSAEMQVDKKAELEAMFEHVWLRTDRIFYTSDMHGVDWKKLKEDYQKYLPHIGNEHEFAEMLSEMLGELNVSHAGARYSTSDPKGDQTASLGIFPDYAYKGTGLKIAEIIKGGPLDRADLSIKKGMIIEQMDGVALDKTFDYHKLLNRKAGKYMLLHVRDPQSKQLSTYRVKPISLAEEGPLLYKRWIKINQAEVDRLSKGRLGYIHIPSMGDGPYRSTYEEMMGKYHDREGMIIDTRFNGGGDLVADLAMFFTGEKFLFYANEDRTIGYEPSFRWTKPTLAMFNESNYSDGHCFACGYSDLNIGKTLGMPVPGTCSFAGWERLPNGVIWGTVPLSAKNMAGEWLENNETSPDIQVKNMPGFIDKGKDQQLEKAVEELLKDLE